MKISMNAEFQILKNVGGAFVPMDENDIEYVGPGGFRFVIGGIEVPFDWEAAESGWGYDGVYEFTTGRGWFYNDFELDSCYDEAYEELGLKREDITAEFLASAQHINDFFVSFVTKEGKECEAGWWETNGKDDAPYKLALRSVSFEDVENERLYSVKTAVVNSFNKGVRLVVKALSEDAYADVEMLDICSGNSVANMLDCVGYAWGLFEGDTLVGYCTIGGADELVNEEGFSYPGASVDSLLLSDVFVDAEYRGRGYAEFLVDEAVRQATEEANELVFLTVLDDGLARLYEKCGFEVINEKVGLMVRDTNSRTLESVMAKAERVSEEVNNVGVCVEDIGYEK